MANLEVTESDVGLRSTAALPVPTTGRPDLMTNMVRLPRPTLRGLPAVSGHVALGGQFTTNYLWSLSSFDSRVFPPFIRHAIIRTVNKRREVVW